MMRKLFAFMAVMIAAFVVVGCQGGDAGTPEAEAEAQAQSPDMAE